MQSLVRLFMSFVALVAAYFIVLVPLSALLRPGGPLVLLSLVCASVAAWVAWRYSGWVSEGLATAVVTGAMVTGVTGFTAGFFGPMIVAPGANQGPMLGIFITGPLGAVAGAVGGAIYWVSRGRHVRPPEG
jgi:hypothetical protein